MISSPVSILKVVVFPAPLTPRRPKHSWAKNVKNPQKIPPCLWLQRWALERHQSFRTSWRGYTPSLHSSSANGQNESLWNVENSILSWLFFTWNTESFSSLTSLSTLLGISTLDPYTISFILIHSSLVMFSSVKMRIVQKRRTLTARMTRLMLIPDWESQVQKERVSLMIGMSWF